MTDKHAPNTCPRCGNLFTCRVDAVLTCDCLSLSFSPAELASIRAYTELTFGAYTCLCVNCLRALHTEHRQFTPADL